MYHDADGARRQAEAGRQTEAGRQRQQSVLDLPMPCIPLSYISTNSKKQELLTNSKKQELLSVGKGRLFEASRW